MIRTALAILLLAALCGCVTDPVAPPVSNAVPVVIRPTEPAQDAVLRRAVCIGVSNTAGGGNPCPGTDTDARTVAAWMRDRPITLLLDAAATREGIMAAIREATTGMDAASLLTVSISGHGTQRRDTSGDEADGMDEGLVLWDGVWWDDDVWAFIRTLPACRVEIISDTCHSAGNWRVLTLGLGEPRYRQMEFDLGDDRRDEDWPGQLWQVAGCDEGGWSYGSPDGGTLTQTLDRMRSDGITRHRWFLATSAAMPLKQQPAVTTYNATDEFLHGEALK